MAPTLYFKPEPGDLIEIFRGAFEHWALYVGNGYVVHLAPASEVSDAGVSSVMSVPTTRAVVKKEKLLYVVGTDRWKINNSLDEKYKPRLGCDIVREALARVGEKLLYTVISRNCEHFVTELRYGKAKSRQVLFKGGAILMATSAAFGVPGIVGLGIVALGGALIVGSMK